jgi:hypothetical protein
MKPQHQHIYRIAQPSGHLCLWAMAVEVDNQKGAKGK